MNERLVEPRIHHQRHELDALRACAGVDEAADRRARESPPLVERRRPAARRSRSGPRARGSSRCSASPPVEYQSASSCCAARPRPAAASAASRQMSFRTTQNTVHRSTGPPSTGPPVHRSTGLTRSRRCSRGSIGRVAPASIDSAGLQSQLASGSVRVAVAHPRSSTHMRLHHLGAMATGLACALAIPAPSSAQIDARMLRQPTVSATQIAFIYGGDIWIMPKTGGTAERLTTAVVRRAFRSSRPTARRSRSRPTTMATTRSTRSRRPAAKRPG